MLDLQDKLMIFAACVVLYAVDAGYAMSVIPVITALTLSSLNSYFDIRLIRLIFLGVYTFICSMNPSFIVFLPLLCYDIFVTGEQFFSLMVLIPFTAHFGQLSATLKAIIVLLFLISYLMKYRTSSYMKLHQQYTSYMDASKERSLLLEKKNSDLLDKQDYEINVAILNERNRIAMEIHDNVGHLLSRCLLQLGAIMAVNKSPELKENLSSIKDTLSQAMDSIRNSVHNLHDESIDLYGQVQTLVDSFTFCPVVLDYDINSNMDKKLKYSFIAIIKEGLSNIIKHSNATEVHITLREHPALYQLVIWDNGTVTGYTMDNGIGLGNITKRVDTFHGNIHINIENGFKIFISIPKSTD